MRLETGDVARLVVGALRDAGDREAIQWTIDHHQSFLSACAQIADVVNRKRIARGRPVPEWPTAPAPVKTGWRLAIRNNARISNDQERGPMTIVRPEEKKPAGYNIVVEAHTAFDAHALRRVERPLALLGFLAFLKDLQPLTAVAAQVQEVKDRAMRLFGPLVTRIGARDVLDQASAGYAPAVVHQSVDAIDDSVLAMGIWLQFWNALAGTRLAVVADGFPTPQLAVMRDSDGWTPGLAITLLGRVTAEEQITSAPTWSSVLTEAHDYFVDLPEGPFVESPEDGQPTTVEQAVVAMLYECFGYTGPFNLDSKRLQAQAEDEMHAAGNDDPEALNRRWSEIIQEAFAEAFLSALQAVAKDSYSVVADVLGRQVLTAWSPIRAIDRASVPEAAAAGAKLGVRR